MVDRRRSRHRPGRGPDRADTPAAARSGHAHGRTTDLGGSSQGSGGAGHSLAPSPRETRRASGREAHRRGPARSSARVPPLRQA